MSITDSDTVQFVRETMLDEREPPITAAGPVGWARTNLFNGWSNSLLTLVSLYLIYWLFAAILPWIISPTWNAGSLTQCREILAEQGKTGHFAGACWGVIRERWLQLLFGFYPSELYWRPILTFVLTGVALAPVLFSGAPRKLLYVTAAIPFLMPWLLWGGSIWVPICIGLGFVIMFFANRFLAPVMGSLGALVSAVVLAVLWWFLLSGSVATGLAGIIPIGIEPVASRDFGGFMLSITIGVVAIGLSLPLGILLALGRQ